MRVAGSKHQVGYKADLNRQMNKIIDIRDREGLDYGLIYSEDELEQLTREPNVPAYQWLPFANQQYHELSEKYDNQGNMKWTETNIYQNSCFLSFFMLDKIKSVCFLASKKSDYVFLSLIKLNHIFLIFNNSLQKN